MKILVSSFVFAYMKPFIINVILKYSIVFIFLYSSLYLHPILPQ